MGNIVPRMRRPTILVGGGNLTRSSRIQRQMHIALTLPTCARVCCALSSTSSSSITNSRCSPPGEGDHWRRGVGRAVPVRSPYCGDNVVSTAEIGEQDGDGADGRLSTGRRLRFSLSAIYVIPPRPLWSRTRRDASDRQHKQEAARALIGWSPSPLPAPNPGWRSRRAHSK